MRVIVTGSRDWSDRYAVFAALDRMAEAAREVREPLVVAHGCAKGADALAQAWVDDRRDKGWPVDAARWPANWNHFGARAGYVRNEAMVRDGADVCVVFLLPCSKEKCKRPKPHGSHGTTHCGEAAEAADIRTVWADPHGLRGRHAA